MWGCTACACVRPSSAAQRPGFCFKGHTAADSLHSGSEGGQQLEFIAMIIKHAAVVFSSSLKWKYRWGGLPAVLSSFSFYKIVIQLCYSVF